MIKKILYSPGFGAGFYTWNKDCPEVITDHIIINMVESKNFEGIIEYLNNKYNNNFYCGGVYDLEIYEIEEGTEFYIEEYDGNETIITKKQLSFIA